MGATTEAFPSPDLSIVLGMVKYSNMKMVEIQSYSKTGAPFYGEKLRLEHLSASRIRKKWIQRSLKGVDLRARREILSWALMEDSMGVNKHMFSLTESDFKGMRESVFIDFKVDFFFENYSFRNGKVFGYEDGGDSIFFET